MVSIRARSLDVSSVELTSAMPKRAVDSAYTCARPDVPCLRILNEGSEGEKVEVNPDALVTAYQQLRAKTAPV